MDIFQKKLNKVEIQLSGKDSYDLLKFINEYVENTYPIYDLGCNSEQLQTLNVYRLTLSCKEVKQFFKEYYNIDDGPKTSVVQTPLKFYSEDCAKMYIRGVIDGDGSVSDQLKLRLITQSECFIDGIIDIIKQYTKVDVWKINWGEYPGFEIQTARAKPIIQWAYSINSNVGLKYKNDKVYGSNYFQERPIQ